MTWLDREACPTPAPCDWQDGRHVATIWTPVGRSPQVLQICKGCGCRLTSEKHNMKWLSEALVIEEEPV